MNEWICAGIIVIVLLAIVLSACRISGDIAQHEEDEYGWRRS